MSVFSDSSLAYVCGSYKSNVMVVKSTWPLSLFKPGRSVKVAISCQERPHLPQTFAGLLFFLIVFVIVCHISEPASIVSRQMMPLDELILRQPETNCTHCDYDPLHHQEHQVPFPNVRTHTSECRIRPSHAFVGKNRSSR